MCVPHMTLKGSVLAAILYVFAAALALVGLLLLHTNITANDIHHVCHCMNNNTIAIAGIEHGACDFDYPLPTCQVEE